MSNKDPFDPKYGDDRKTPPALSLSFSVEYEDVDDDDRKTGPRRVKRRRSMDALPSAAATTAASDDHRPKIRKRTHSVIIWIDVELEPPRPMERLNKLWERELWKLSREQLSTAVKPLV